MPPTFTGDRGMMGSTTFQGIPMRGQFAPMRDRGQIQNQGQVTNQDQSSN